MLRIICKGYLLTRAYHLIQLHERVRAAVIPFETAKEKLRQRLAFERGQARLKEPLAEEEWQVSTMITGAHEHSTAGVESRAGRRGARRQELLHGNFYMVAAMTHTHGWSAHPLKCRPNQAGIRPRRVSGTRLAQLIGQCF